MPSQTPNSHCAVSFVSNPWPCLEDCQELGLWALGVSSLESRDIDVKFKVYKYRVQEYFNQD